MFSYKANARIASFDITEEDISLIIKNLDPAKAHGCDNISKKMIKISYETLTVPLKIIFEQSLKESRFPEICSRTQKKKDKNILKHYRPISLLPIVSKVFERVIYNSPNHFQSNNPFYFFTIRFFTW